MSDASFPGTGLESLILQGGGGPVCGVDEVGRGPLAGPVVAAAVVLPLRLTGSVGTCKIPETLTGLNDSKRLSAKERQRFLCAIRALALDVHVGMATPREIDRLNIRQATLLAMSRAVRGLMLMPEAAVLVDGRDIPENLPCPARAVVQGDQISISIAAASVVAKEVRDTMMVTLASQSPGYDWAQNRGYSTVKHRRALAMLGVTEQHRRSFAPVQKILERLRP